ncbi:MAG: hypothetical protein WD534_14220 [Phycisphaeraceae bacterium]
MKRHHLFAILLTALLGLVFTDTASAMYHPGLGRHMQRDPNGMQMGSAAPRVAGGPAVSGGFIQRDFNPHQQYADGMNLYQYVGSNPVNYVDPDGLRRKVIALEGWGTAVGLSDSFVTYNDRAGAIVADKVESRDWHYFDWTDYAAAKAKAIEVAQAPDGSPPDCYHTLTLIGYSNGADAAHDLAHELMAEGIAVNLVVTMDAVPRGGKGVGDFLNPFAGPNYSKSANTDRWVNFYQRFSDPKGWSMQGADVDHRFTTRTNKRGWDHATWRQVFAGVRDPNDPTKWLHPPVSGLEEIVKGTPFSFAEHVSVPLHHRTLTEIRSSVGNVSEWRSDYKYSK